MRLIPRRRPELPDAAAQVLGIEHGERVLAWSELVGNGYAAATGAGLRILTPFGALIRRPWVEVDHLAWDADSRTLAVWWVGVRQATGLELPEDSYLPEVAHERWRTSVVATREVALPGRRTAMVALRKAADGALSVQANLPAGVRADDAEVAAIVATAQAELGDEAGLVAAPTGIDDGGRQMWGFGNE
jgi:hypothetical protein